MIRLHVASLTWPAALRRPISPRAATPSAAWSGSVSRRAAHVNRRAASPGFSNVLPRQALRCPVSRRVPLT
ncbi:MAG: hypothetical protein U0V87_13755 [Acidobacteriota bacterium]